MIKQKKYLFLILVCTISSLGVTPYLYPMQRLQRLPISKASGLRSSLAAHVNKFCETRFCRFGQKNLRKSSLILTQKLSNYDKPRFSVNGSKEQLNNTEKLCSEQKVLSAKLVILIVKKIVAQLIEAIEHSDVDKIKTLLSSFADVKAKIDGCNETQLIIALCKDQIGVVKILLFADTSIYLLNVDDASAWQIAKRTHYIDFNQDPEIIMKQIVMQLTDKLQKKNVAWQLLDKAIAKS